MIDLGRLRQNPQEISELILKKEPSFPIQDLINQDALVREITQEVEQLRKEKNTLAQSGAKGLSQELREQSITLGKVLKEKEIILDAASTQLKDLWAKCPNIPYAELPLGGKEANKEVRAWGTKREFTFPIKHHLELNEKAGWFNMEVGAKMSGGQFALYRGNGVKVIYALTRMMIQNNVAHGFEPIIPPYLVAERALFNAGELPKFEGAYYKTDADNLCLIPTSEVSLTNLHAGDILAAEQLPVRLTSWTNCFRREAGGYGATERGIIRIHQFEKVEIFSICKPEDSDAEQEMMVTCAEKILQKLGLHYRVSLLATQDCSFQSARTYDIEVWLPGQNRYYEVSSCSNCTDFQARRAQIRYRKTTESKPELAHTLNASSLALPRLMIALMENYQQADGTIALPAALLEAMDAIW